MDFTQARRQLADVLLQLGAGQRPAGPLVMGLTPEEDDVEARRRTAEHLAGTLLKDAMTKGVPSLDFKPDFEVLAGGAAADFVFRARVNTSFVVKVQRDAKLKGEALWLQSLHPDVPDATVWGALFPRVLAHQLQAPPYAYAMEDFRREEGYRSLASWIFDDSLLPEARRAQATGLVDHVLTRLETAYLGSKSENSRTSLDGEAYLGRIRSRLQQAAAAFAGFGAACPVTTDQHSFASWHSYLERIEECRSDVEALFPRFETAVHGDLHPGNVIVRLRGDADSYTPDIRLIDPKAWNRGDYVFDLAKLAHYIEVTGPLEHWRLAAGCIYEVQSGTLSVTSTPRVPEWLRELSGRVRSRAITLGRTLGDPNAERRFPLAMASTLLGTVPLRWAKGQHDLAVAMYVEGLQWLAQFSDSL